MITSTKGMELVVIASIKAMELVVITSIEAMSWWRLGSGYGAGWDENQCKSMGLVEISTIRDMELVVMRTSTKGYGVGGDYQ